MSETTVGVVGAGAMGAGIAHVVAAAGARAVLTDVRPGAAEAARSGIGDALGRLVAKGRLASDAAESTLARIEVAGTLGDLPPCAVVVEAIREDLGDKQDLFAALEATQPRDALLATNTSSLDITAIAAATHTPDRVVGLHFFNPAPVMRLVEVVHGRQTSQDTLERALAYVRAWGKTPVTCTSTPGFIVNRVARPYYGEAFRVLEEGLASAPEIDAALRGAGFPMGPFELTDLIGQDVNLAVGTSVWEQTGRDPRYTPVRLQQDLVAHGYLGRKSGQGIYAYAADGSRVEEPGSEALAPGPSDPSTPAASLTHDVVARTIAMLVNEAVDLVHRGEASEADVDVAMQLGTRYPRGPVEWGRELGFDVVARQLAELDEAYPGGRYRPSPGLG